MKRIQHSLKIWWMMTKISASVTLQSRIGSGTFVAGKLIRFTIFSLFLLAIITKTQALAGYSFWEVIFFYAVYNFIDTIPQFFMRSVYEFRGNIITGYFDFLLSNPFSPLFRVLFSGTDILDAPMIIISFALLVYAGFHLSGITIVNMFLCIVLIFNALIIALAFHIATAALAILTTEIDNIIWIYRDTTQMGRFPINIYREPLRSFITFIIPVGVMMTFPAQAFLGLLSPLFILWSFWIGAFLLIGSLIFWKHALTKYASASS